MTAASQSTTISVEGGIESTAGSIYQWMMMKESPSSGFVGMLKGVALLLRSS